MNGIEYRFTIDGQSVPFTPGETILQAANRAGIFIPSLCSHPEFKPHGSCKLCNVVANGRVTSACATRAVPGLDVLSDTPEINGRRRILLQMLFVEGNHFCPGCEKSGNCKLQALAYDLEMVTPQFPQFFPKRKVDASHPDVLLDFNRCIMCELCVRASRDVDGKNVFGLAGRGMASHVVVNSASDKLVDTNFSADDKAASVCPVGAILKKRVGFRAPIGERTYDKPIRDQIVEGGDVK